MFLEVGKLYNFCEKKSKFFLKVIKKYPTSRARILCSPLPFRNFRALGMRKIDGRSHLSISIKVCYREYIVIELQVSSFHSQKKVFQVYKDYKDFLGNPENHLI